MIFKLYFALIEDDSKNKCLESEVSSYATLAQPPQKANKRYQMRNLLSTPKVIFSIRGRTEESEVNKRERKRFRSFVH